MTDDRLAQIKRHHELHDITMTDVDWLVAEVERLREQLDEHDYMAQTSYSAALEREVDAVVRAEKAEAEVERLRASRSINVDPNLAAQVAAVLALCESLDESPYAVDVPDGLMVMDYREGHNTGQTLAVEAVRRAIEGAGK